MLSFNSRIGHIFGGEIGDADVMGTQFWANVEAAVMENLKVGADLIYSDGNDTDDEIKITALELIGVISVLWTAVRSTPTSCQAASLTFSTRRLSVVGLDYPLEFGAQGGSMGGGVYAVFTPMEGLDLSAQLMFLSADEDDIDDGFIWSDVTVYSIGAEWFFAPNTSVAATYHVSDWSSDIDAFDDSMDVIAARLQVTF